jgi:chaperonin cofactor prefoldin
MKKHIGVLIARRDYLEREIERIKDYDAPMAFTLGTLFTELDKTVHELTLRQLKETDERLEEECRNSEHD